MSRRLEINRSNPTGNRQNQSNIRPIGNTSPSVQNNTIPSAVPIATPTTNRYLDVIGSVGSNNINETNRIQNNTNINHPSTVEQDEETLIRFASELSMQDLSQWNDDDHLESIHSIKLLEEIIDVEIRDHPSITPYSSHTRTNNNQGSSHAFQLVESLTKKLKLLKQKLERAINNSSDDSLMSTLIDFNDFMSTILIKAESFISPFNPEITTRDYTPNYQPNLTRDTNNYLSTSFDSPRSLYSSGFVSRSDSYDKQDNVNTNSASVKIMPLLYTIRRGRREETLSAVSELIQMCNLQGTSRISAISAMKSVGMLQALLSSLTRASDWPEVEIYICTMICVLIIFEDDFKLLYNSAYDILTSLYILQLKSTERAKDKLEAALLGPINVSQDIILSTGLIDSHLDLSTELTYGVSDRQLRDLRSLVSSALAKLSLVISVECSKADEIDNKSQPSAAQALLMYGGGFSTLAGDRSSGSIRQTSGGKITTSSSTSGESDRALETLLNVLRSVCEESAITSESTEVLRSSKHPLFNRSNNDKELTLNNLESYYIDHCRIRYYESINVNELAPVLCSIALSYLAKVPQCRVGIIGSDGLAVIRQLINMETEVLTRIYTDMKVTNVDVYSNNQFNYLSTLFKESSYDYELVKHAALAIMYLVGGKDHTNLPSKKFKGFSSNGYYEYTVGWIDAKVLAEGIPDTLVRFLNAVMEMHVICLNDSSIIEESTSNMFPLPKLVCMYISQALYQISSRPNNRQHLSNVGAPVALCNLFAYTVKSCRDTATVMYATDVFSSNYSANSNAAVPILSRSSSSSPTFHDQSSDPMSLSYITSGSIISSTLESLTFFLSNTSSAFMNLLENVSSLFVVEALVYMMSVVSRSHVRLACLKILAILSDLPNYLANVISSEIPQLVINIVSEYEEVANTFISSSTNSSEAVTRKLEYTRNVSNNSVTSFGRNSSTSSMTNLINIAKLNDSRHSSLKRAAPRGSADRSLQSVLLRLDRDSSDSLETADLNLEETHYSLFTLCNIIKLSKDNAELLYNCGLLSVCLQISDSKNIDISSRSINCISKLCPVIHSSSSLANKQARLHDMIESYEALVKGLFSPDLNIQYDSLVGLSSLAMNSSIICDEIIHGPFKHVVNILIDHNNRDITFAAEELVKSVGFTRGLIDIELCGYDNEILIEWYDIRRSLQPQRLSLQIMYKWIDDMFYSTLPYGCTNNNPKVNLSTRSLSDIMNLTNHDENSSSAYMDLAQTTASILHLPKNDSNQVTLANGTNRTSPASKLHKNLFKYIPFLGKFNHSIDNNSDNDNFDSSNSKSSFTFSKLRLSGKSSGYNISDFEDRNSGLFTKQIDDWLDRVPVGLLDLLDLFYPSKILQQSLIDLTSLGLYDSIYDVFPSLSFNSLNSSIASIKPLLLPRPHPINGLSLASRVYLSFSRIGRVIERIIEEEGPDKQWSISFRDSEFFGDFHETVLGTLRKCPQITSLSFTVGSSKVEHEAHLGHLAGNIPSSVRSIIFKGSISRESIQALCILLKKQNAAFMPPSTDEMAVLAKTITSKYKPSISINKETSINKDNIDYSVNWKVALEAASRSRPLKGLINLSITHSILDSTEISYIIDLLNTFTSNNLTNKKVIRKNSFIFKPASHSHVAQYVAGSFLKGLRYLDLSYNRLSDNICAEILQGAAHGPLEGLDLSGNNITKGTVFIDCVKAVLDNAIHAYTPIDPSIVTSTKISYLRHLGLAHNNLTTNETIQIDKDSNTSAAIVSNDAISETIDENVEVSGDNEYIPASNVLNVFFSAPLAWRDRFNKYHALELLDYAAERDALVQVFREVHRDICLNFDFATIDTLRTSLTLGCRALHFSGHGHPQCLNFEDGHSGLQLVTLDSLKQLLRAGGLKLDFVFVSACHSRKTGEAFIEAGVPHVVCVKVDAMIQDSAAMSFTRAFYVALLSGSSVSQAFEIATEALKSSPYVSNSVLEGEKFVLLPEHVSHDQAVFIAPKLPQWPSEKSHLVGRGYSSGAWIDGEKDPSANSVSLPQAPPDYEGREVDMHRVITTLLSRRLVTLVGDFGVGKSALSAAVCTYVAERGIFSDGVIFVRAQPLKSHSELLQYLKLAIMNNCNPRLRLLMSSADSQPNDSSEEEIFRHEESIVSALSQLKLLLIIDNVDKILINSDAANDFKFFLGRLFERCKHIKVLITSTGTLGIRRLNGFGVAEHCIPLGPLSLRSSLRLFARLAPPLMTAASKIAFINALLPINQANVTVDSQELDSTGSQILALFGNGHPARVVKLACQSSQENVDYFMAEGTRIIARKDDINHFNESINNREINTVS
eukprot:gene18081-23729_t